MERTWLIWRLRFDLGNERDGDEEFAGTVSAATEREALRLAHANGFGSQYRVTDASPCWRDIAWERAAIAEYDGGLTRADAEALARAEREAA